MLFTAGLYVEAQNITQDVYTSKIFGLGLFKGASFLSLGKPKVLRFSEKTIILLRYKLLGLSLELLRANEGFLFKKIKTGLFEATRIP